MLGRTSWTVGLSLLVAAVSITAALPAGSATNCFDAGVAEGCAGLYNDDDRMRSGYDVWVEAFGCHAGANGEYLDGNGDHLPDTVPPGGPPPNNDQELYCLR